jgi:hypothetical protein
VGVDAVLEVSFLAIDNSNWVEDSLQRTDTTPATAYVDTPQIEEQDDSPAFLRLATVAG